MNGCTHTRSFNFLTEKIPIVSSYMAQPLKLAIIGGGASGFYVASRILAKLPAALEEAQIHMYDRLWTPHGLVRYGVAPDHPEVKVSFVCSS